MAALPHLDRVPRDAVVAGAGVRSARTRVERTADSDDPPVAPAELDHSATLRDVGLPRRAP